MNCLHLVVEDDVWDDQSCTFKRHRVCLLCGVSYDRSAFLAMLQEDIRARNRLGPTRLTQEDYEDNEEDELPE